LKTNLFLSERTAQDIDLSIEKLLRELGHPGPPLSLDDVRALLRLDKGYYSSSEDGFLRQTVHRLTVAGKQVLRRPSLLLDIVKKCDLRALWLPDRKQILIDSELPKVKERWGEAHEIGHSVIPWHEAMTHGDRERTLSPGCHAQIEAEANFAAGRLLFLRNVFAEQILSAPVDFNHVRALAKGFGNTMTSALWRAVEVLDTPAIGLVSMHPRSAGVPGKEPVRYFIRSRRFENCFCSVSGEVLFTALRGFCFGRRGPLGEDEVVLADDNGVEHVFFLESFYNGHEALTLGIHRRIRRAVLSVGEVSESRRL
jgi:hypothetical protein